MSKKLDEHEADYFHINKESIGFPLFLICGLCIFVSAFVSVCLILMGIFDPSSLQLSLQKDFSFTRFVAIFVSTTNIFFIKLFVKSKMED